jgi:hypothetical protein
MKLQEGRYTERGSRRRTGNEKKIGEGEAGNSDAMDKREVVCCPVLPWAPSLQVPPNENTMNKQQTPFRV